MLRSRTRISVGLSVVLVTAFALAGCPTNPNEPPGDAGVADARDSGLPPTDGGGTDGGTTTTVTICPGDALPPLASGVCEVSGSGPGLLIQADVLAPDQVFRGGQVLVDATGTITCVGCDCSGEAGAAAATHVTCPDGVLSPGLVNAHEHITFLGQPYTANLTSGERYEHRHDWRKARNGHTRIPSPAAPNQAVNIPWAELRMVLGGATSINASGGAPGFLRNLDSADMEGLGHAQVDYNTFPLDDRDTGLEVAMGCDTYSATRTTAADVSGELAFTPHIAEGIGLAARNEFLCQSSGAFDLIQPQTAMIHGVGLLPVDMQAVAADGTTLIWSPRSNITLYGDTARVVEYDRMGVAIAMGTDWIYSGSMNMLRELQCADELNATYYDDHFTDAQLWRMATYNGAVALGVEDAIGSIAVGRVADLAIFDATIHVDHRAVIDATNTDVALVLRAGVPLYGEDAVVAGIPSGGTGCDTFDVCGETRRACVMREVGMTFSALESANAGQYDLFACATPPNEPSCRPERDGAGSFPMPSVMGSTVYSGMTSATDADGDGIADAMDNCPAIFNPVRPLDMGMQANSDGDALGDSCDPCPLDADTTTCSTIDPNDRDHDGVLDTTDNCPGLANSDQADMDSDGHGDACDPCPMTANPGAAACPASIYAVQMGTIGAGSSVALHGVVSAVGPNGFFLQTPVGASDYIGADYSGVYVYTSTAPSVAAGAAVDVSGMVSTYMTEVQIGSPTVTMTGTGTIPDPVSVTAAEIATGGARARRLEGVLVQVTNVAVTDVAPPPGTSDTAPTYEFVVAGSLRVDDMLFRVAPFPLMAENFASITGIVGARNGNSRLLPRNAADIVGGTPVLATFDPPLSFIDVGATSATTFPTPLTVHLTRAATTDTVVTLVSGNPAALSVPATVTVPAGQTMAPVLVTALAQNMAVTVTATLGGMLTADVRVLGATEVPGAFTLSPSMAMLSVGAMATFTVTLDIPAPAGGETIALADTTGGTLPANVTVPAGQLSATFPYVAPAAAATGTITATLRGTIVQTANVAITTGPPGHLMINEIDYDQVGGSAMPDSMEFVEIYNSSSAPISLTGLSLVFVNGGTAAMSTYMTVDLSSAVDVPSHGYLVVGSMALLNTITADRELALTGTTNIIQNGMPDGVAIYDTVAMHLVDALSYEGSITAGSIGGHSFSLVEGTALAASVADSDTVVGSLCRLPNGTDADNAATDWAFSPMRTPGEDNVSM